MLVLLAQQTRDVQLGTAKMGYAVNQGKLVAVLILIVVHKNIVI
jgi:hypothetical protein